MKKSKSGSISPSRFVTVMEIVCDPCATSFEGFEAPPPQCHTVGGFAMQSKSVPPLLSTIFMGSGKPPALEIRIVPPARPPRVAPILHPARGAVKEIVLVRAGQPNSFSPPTFPRQSRTPVSTHFVLYPPIPVTPALQAEPDDGDER